MATLVIIRRGRVGKENRDGDTGRVKFEGVRSINNIWNTTNTTINNNKRNSTSWG